MRSVEQEQFRCVTQRSGAQEKYLTDRLPSRVRSQCFDVLHYEHLWLDTFYNIKEHKHMAAPDILRVHFASDREPLARWTTNNDLCGAALWQVLVLDGAADNVIPDIRGVGFSRKRIALVRPDNIEAGSGKAEVEATGSRVEGNHLMVRVDKWGGRIGGHCCRGCSYRHCALTVRALVRAPPAFRTDHAVMSYPLALNRAKAGDIVFAVIIQMHVFVVSLFIAIGDLFILSLSHRFVATILLPQKAQQINISAS